MAKLNLPPTFIRAEEIEQKASAFLAKHHPSLEIPVPVEQILEIQLKFRVVPIPGLMKNLQLDGWFILEKKELFIDHDLYMEDSNARARFTIAHELGHYHLHKEIFRKIEFKSIEEWKHFYSNEVNFSPYETQANMFASMILMPAKALSKEYKRIKTKNIKENQKISQIPDETLLGYFARELARKFDVSEDAMKYRLANLNSAGRLVK